MVEKQTDLTRWADRNNLNPAWNKRSEIAAWHISKGENVLDIGCGNMFYRKMSS